MVYVCTDVGCGTIAKSGAIMGGYTYYNTIAECQAACPVQYWCVDNSCVAYWVGYTPSGSPAGPFATINLCYDECDTGPGYYCLGGVCGYYASRPPGATGPRANTYAECVPNCFVLDGPVLGQAYEVKPVQEQKKPPVVRRFSDKQMERIRIPCIHRGEKIESGFT
jgi:hypothetical protein